MRDYVIVVDNCSNMVKEKRDEYGIKIAYMHFFIDEKMYDASPDYEVISNVDFNNYMRQGNRITTSQITVGEYEKVFEPILKDGKEIGHVARKVSLRESYVLTIDDCFDYYFFVALVIAIDNISDARRNSDGSSISYAD